MNWALVGVAVLAAFALGARWGIRVAVRRIEGDAVPDYVFTAPNLDTKLAHSIIQLDTGATDEKHTLH